MATLMLPNAEIELRFAITRCQPICETQLFSKRFSMETTRIERENAIQLAAMAVELTYVKVALARMDATNTSQSEKLERVLDQLAEARGGWKTLMLLGGAAGAIGSVITWFVSNLKG
jgi:hypothetical protein